jgi:hypothetical protein
MAVSFFGVIMAHRSRVMYWQCVGHKWGDKVYKRWYLWLGHPDDDDSEVMFDFEESEYRKVIKGLPIFKDGEIFTARLTFASAKAPKRKEKDA